MQIISGKYKGKKLFTLKGRKTRPTSSKVREAIFNICADKVAGASVADLFAGTGAMGIEALSRGARHAVFVESDPGAAELVKRNLSACRAEDNAKVICMDLLHRPSLMKGLGPAFDLVFMDPPYNIGAIGPSLAALVKNDALAPFATIIIEHSDAELLPAGTSGLEIYDSRRYGKTLVSFLSYVVASRNPVSNTP